MENNIERTVIGVKPDAFRPDDEREIGSELLLALPKNPQKFIDEVVHGLQEKCLEVISEHSKVCTEDLARDHYAEFAGVFSEAHWEYQQDFLAKFMNSGKSHWFLCEWEEAVKRWREVVKYIRGKYLLTPKEARYNMIHGSGNVEEARIEEKLHF